jgi:hypothetical protein
MQRRTVEMIMKRRYGAISDLSMVILLLFGPALAGCDGCRGDSDGAAEPEAVAARPADDTESEKEEPDEEVAEEAGGDTETRGDAKERDASKKGAATRRPTPSRPDDPLETMWVGELSSNSRIRINAGRHPFPAEHRPSALKAGREHGSGTADYQPDLVREPFRRVAAVDVLTPEGPVEVELATVRKSVWGQPGAEETDYYVVTEPVDADVTLPEHPTLVTPAGEMADGASLEVAEASTPGRETAEALLSKALASRSPAERRLFETGNLEKLTDEQRESLPDDVEHWGFGLEQGEPMGFKDVSTLEARFPRPHATFVTVAGPEAVDAVGNPFPAFRGVYLVDESGEITATIWETFSSDIEMGHTQLARLEVVAVADPDGDGTDGVLFRADDSLRWIDFRSDGRVVERSFPR